MYLIRYILAYCDYLQILEGLPLKQIIMIVLVIILDTMVLMIHHVRQDLGATVTNIVGGASPFYLFMDGWSNYCHSNKLTQGTNLGGLL
jgi:hypothetical protein